MRDGWETDIYGIHNPDRGYGIFGICFHLTRIPQEESSNFAMLTVRCLENGSIQYLGNQILDDGIINIPKYQYRAGKLEF